MHSPSAPSAGRAAAEASGSLRWHCAWASCRDAVAARVPVSAGNRRPTPSAVRPTGLSGSGLQLSDGSGTPLSITANSAFTFPTQLASGAGYTVGVTAQPSSPAQDCVVSHGSGTVGSADRRDCRDTQQCQCRNREFRRTGDVQIGRFISVHSDDNRCQGGNRFRTYLGIRAGGPDSAVPLLPCSAGSHRRPGTRRCDVREFREWDDLDDAGHHPQYLQIRLYALRLGLGDELQFQPGNSSIAPGSYTSSNTTGGNPFFILSYSQCSTSTVWRLTIYEATAAPDGTAQKFSADFTMSCPSGSPPPISGSVRINSTVSLP